MAVHVVWRSGGAEADKLAHAVFTHLEADPSHPNIRSLGVPVRHWSAGESPETPWLVATPPVVNLDRSERNLVVLLVDNGLVSAGWQDYLAELVRTAGSGSGNWFLPFSLTPNFARIPALTQVDVVDLHSVPVDLREQVFLNHVLHRVCRQIGNSDPVRVFVSYASRDGGDIAREVSRHLRLETDVDDFLDAHHIAGGDRFADILDTAAMGSPLLAVNTDSYSARLWCQREFLGAKRGSMPVVVLDAMRDGSVRTFPYLGNVPAVRWYDGSRSVLDRLVGVLLTEALRHRYFPLRAAEICGKHGVALPPLLLARPPELLSLLDIPRFSTGTGQFVDLLYPDPPLGAEETRLLAELDSSLRPVTPTMLFSS
ncbi:TIR domain-containing protein [Frankia sp. Cppng1_Ct_nod]|uniref:TIR domain-containing protein n=1 Tax=Frankia sp. Cppng1_Ct_nod TaxID=2897162 RepID=UPI0013EFA70E|nr:TIR domain-containing protein [Frankia sp. Cppng1_Ct_nod]